MILYSERCVCHISSKTFSAAPVEVERRTPRQSTQASYHIVYVHIDLASLPFQFKLYVPQFAAIYWNGTEPSTVTACGLVIQQEYLHASIN